jgi:hypothetical protein
MTSVALTRIGGGIVRLSAFAVISSSVVRCPTGRSAALAPFRIFAA